MLPHETEALKQTLGCYLHQDWCEEFSSERDAFDLIAREVSEETVVAAIRGIDALIMSSRTDHEIAELMTSEIGCYLNPAYRNLTHRQWLAEAKASLISASANGS